MRKTEFGPLTGAVYVYLIKDDGWQLLKKLTTDNPDEDDTFGLSLSMNDKYLAVGAPQDSNKNGIYAGALYLYKKTSDTTWVKDTVLIAPTGYWFDGFGSSSVIDSLHLIVSACGNVYSPLPGRVYVYKNNGGKWIIEQVLTGKSSDTDYFGYSMSLKEDSLLLGASYAKIDDIRSGAAYLYKRNKGKWEESFIFQPSDGTEYDYFGSSVSISDDILIGAESKRKIGGAYFYSGIATGLESGDILPNEIVLYQNYPNPFNPTTKISYYLPESGVVEIKVFDIIGREIAVLANEYKSSGNNAIVFNAGSIPSGVYFCSLSFNNGVHERRHIKTIKMTLIK